MILSQEFFKERIYEKNSFILSTWVFGTCKSKIKSTINGSKNIKKNYPPADKYLVGEGAGKEDVRVLGEPNDEVS